MSTPRSSEFFREQLDVLVRDAQRLLTVEQYETLVPHLVERCGFSKCLWGERLEKGTNVGNEILELLKVAHSELPEGEADRLDAWFVERLARYR